MRLTKRSTGTARGKCLVLFECATCEHAPLLYEDTTEDINQAGLQVLKQIVSVSAVSAKSSAHFFAKRKIENCRARYTNDLLQ